MKIINRLKGDRGKFNIFLFVSAFAKSLIEIFISVFLFKNGFSLRTILIFYFLENIFALFVSYFFVRIGERFKYTVVMYIGIAAFIILQIVLNNIVYNELYVIVISLLYAFYRRGYWIARRYYETRIIPQRDSSEPFSIMMVIAEAAVVLAGFLGGLLLDSFSAVVLTVTASILLFVSVVPLFMLKNKDGEKTEIELFKNLKKYDKRNYVAFSLFEINNVLSFIFPIFILLYIKDTYTTTGLASAISGIATIIFILFYGQALKKRNFFVISSALFILISLTKLLFIDYFILIMYFVEGLIKKMQSQSESKIYFENRNGMDLTHYNLIYHLVESLARAAVTIPLLFMSSIKVMVIFVLLVMSIELVIYSLLKKGKKLD